MVVSMARGVSCHIGTKAQHFQREASCLTGRYKPFQ